MTVRLIPVEDVDGWRDALPAHADVYNDPGYVAAAALRAPAWLAVTEKDGATLSMAFVTNEIPEWLKARGYYDAESIYGYPGIFASGDPERWTACWQELIDALAARSIVNLFLRMNPMDAVDAARPYLFEWERETAWIPLERGPDDAFAGSVGRTHRSQVSRARAMGFTCGMLDAPDRDALLEFQSMYDATMDRVGADRSYRFSPAYYEALQAGLGKRLTLAKVFSTDGTCQAGALFMRGPRWGHYHLSGRRADAHNVAGHLLLQSAAEWGVEKGLAGIHLGGGATPASDDPLLRFKKRIGQGRAVFRCAGVVSHPAVHEALIARWRGATGLVPDRFQAYRQRRGGMEDEA